MDRRNFFKTIVATPLIAPFLLASQKNKAECELLLIADEPEKFISFILEEVKEHQLSYGKSFAFLNAHPQRTELINALGQKGWKHILNPAQADLALSFSHLHQKANPSFSLVKEGRIWDIRTQKLSLLWKEMNKNLLPSYSLTIASFQKQGSIPSSGKFINIYKDGQVHANLSLQLKTERTFKTMLGAITARIDRGKAWVVASACRHKICQYTPPVSKPGERIICAPDHFLLEISGDSSPDTVIG